MSAGSYFQELDMNINRMSGFTLGAGADLPKDVMLNYSRMKYGDPVATRMLAQMLKDKLLSIGPLRDDLFQDAGVVIASSAYGAIPTAAHALTKELSLLLQSEGVFIQPVKIHREQALGNEDYATLNHRQRGAVLATRKLSISKSNLASMRGRMLLVVDDLIATGSHEKATIELVSDTSELAKIQFVYIFEFSEQLRDSNPMAESHINSHYVKNIDDYFELVNEVKTTPYINARVVKFLLGEGISSPEMFKAILRKLPLEFCERFHSAAVSSDMHQIGTDFLPAIEMLKESLLGRHVAQRLEVLNP